MTDIAAAIGLHQLRKAGRFLQKRAHLAELYSRKLADVEEIITPVQNPNRIHSWHLYAIRLRLEKLSIDRAAVIDELKSAGIGTSVHWQPLHLHPYYRETCGCKPEDLPCAARVYQQLISLPIYPDMTEGEVEFVCSKLKDIVARNRKELFIPSAASNLAASVH